MEGSWYQGSDIKTQVTLTAAGFDMDLDEWSIHVYLNGKKVHTYPKHNCRRDDDGKWYCCISRDYLKKSGSLMLVGEAGIQDTDFEDGLRHETDVAKIGTYKKV